MKILVFTEGTLLMHPSSQWLSREARVEQSKKREEIVFAFKYYIPIGSAVEKIKEWKRQGAEIFYLTSRTEPDQINDIRNVLRRYGFPDFENLLFQKANEEYIDAAERLMPEIIIEDDCESIGGEQEMIYPQLSQELRKKIQSIVVKEFGGIDHLPGEIQQLLMTID